MDKILGYNIDIPDCVIKLKDNGPGFGPNTTTYSSIEDFYEALTTNSIQLTDNVRIEVIITDLSSNEIHYPGLLLCDSIGSCYQLWYFDPAGGYEIASSNNVTAIKTYEFYTHNPK